MDRFIVKEPRVVAGYPQGNEMNQLPANARNGNIISPENVYFGGYPPNFHNQQGAQNMHSQINQIRSQSGLNSPQMAQLQMNSPYMGQPQTFPTMIPQSHMSGIDPRYLSAYGDASPQYILAGQQLQRNQPLINSFGNDYENRSFEGVERNKTKNVSQKCERNMNIKQQVMTLGGLEPTRVEEMPRLQNAKVETKNVGNQMQSFQNNLASKKPTEPDLIRNDVQIQMMTRTDKLKILKHSVWNDAAAHLPKALQKSGPRAFSGPVEKVLKWHKTLQDIGILIIYEVVAKCVSIRSGEKSAKNLVVRDDSGPAMQVVYYEIDFLLPELKPPCTVRVVGRMLAGTCRLQAFNVRAATGDDVATLPRRAAVAAHHVAKLSKEYGNGGKN